MVTSPMDAWVALSVTSLMDADTRNGAATHRGACVAAHAVGLHCSGSHLQTMKTISSKSTIKSTFKKSIALVLTYFLVLPLISGDRRKERRKVMQANSRSKLLQDFPAEIYIKK